MLRTDSLRRQHDQLVVLVQDISKKLTLSEVSANPTEVRMMLSKLIGVLQIHLAAEDKILYPDLLKSPDAKVKAVTKRFIDEMGGIGKAGFPHQNFTTLKLR